MTCSKDSNPPSGVGRIGNMCSMATAISIAFRIVPIPGFSLSGIHNNRTATLTKNVAWPMVRSVINAIPSAKTVQGVLPTPAATITASPVPNIQSPTHNISRVEGFGLGSIGSVELHQVTGTSLAGLSIERNAMLPRGPYLP